MAEPLAPIMLTIETPASPADAWAALTEPERIAEWFTDASPLAAVGEPYRLEGERQTRDDAERQRRPRGSCRLQEGGEHTGS